SCAWSQPRCGGCTAVEPPHRAQKRDAAHGTRRNPRGDLIRFHPLPSCPCRGRWLPRFPKRRQKRTSTMLSLHTNASVLNIQNTLASNKSALNTSMTRLGTGYKINSAADDAAGLQIATRLLAQTRGMTVAAQNT